MKPTNMDAESFDRRLFLRAVGSAAIVAGFTTTAQADNQQNTGEQNRGQARFVEGGIEYTTDASIHTNHTDRIGVYDVQSSESRLLIHIDDEKLIQPFENNPNVVAASKFQSPPVEITGSTLRRLPTDLNKALYHTGSIPLAEEAGMPPARIKTNNDSVQAQLGKQRREVESGKEVRLVGESTQVEVPEEDDHSAGHSEGANEVEKSETTDNSGHDSKSRTVEVQPELVVRNHGVLDVYTSETGGES